MRHGVGQFTWNDGSFYEGDWVNDVRHGNGIFRTGGEVQITYEGQWVNDIKHGFGKLTYANGEQITGTWRDDRLNGVAKIRKPGKDWEEVIYQDDMLIMNNKKGLTNCELCHTIWAIFFMFAFYGMIPIGLIEDPNLMFIMIGIFFVYAIHACC